MKLLEPTFYRPPASARLGILSAENLCPKKGGHRVFLAWPLADSSGSGQDFGRLFGDEDLGQNGDGVGGVPEPNSDRRAHVPESGGDEFNVRVEFAQIYIWVALKYRQPTYIMCLTQSAGGKRNCVVVFDLCEIGLFFVGFLAFFLGFFFLCSCLIFLSSIFYCWVFACVAKLLPVAILSVMICHLNILDREICNFFLNQTQCFPPKF